MNICKRGRADWISYKEEEGKKIPQGVIELSTSGKMTETRENSIILNSCTEPRVVVHDGLNF